MITWSNQISITNIYIYALVKRNSLVTSVGKFEGKEKRNKNHKTLHSRDHKSNYP